MGVRSILDCVACGPLISCRTEPLPARELLHRGRQVRGVRLGPGPSDPLDPLDNATEDPAKCKEFNAKAKEEVKNG
jgi:hypothetical protein